MSSPQIKYALMRDDATVDALLSKAERADRACTGPEYEDLTYAAGVRHAIEFLIGISEDEPLADLEGDDG